MADLPADVVAGVLSALPVKLLMRFRCVSKQWCGLIDSQFFIKSHLNRSIETNTNRSLILKRYIYLGACHLFSVNLDWASPIGFKGCPVVFNGLGYSIDRMDPVDDQPPCEEVLGCCNGLLCLFDHYEYVVLWNPSTRKRHKLPFSSIEMPHRSTPQHCCNLIPITQFCGCRYILYGFGYDGVNDDYKVVRIVKCLNGSDSEVKVYSLKSNSWRRVEDFPYDHHHHPYEESGVDGVLVNGALHWTLTSTPHAQAQVGVANLTLIAAFDLGVEEFQLVPQPEYLDTNIWINVGSLGGCLCILCTLVLTIDVWVMEEYGVKESWIKLFAIQKSSFSRPVAMGDVLKPIGYSKGGGEVLLGQRRWLHWYDLKKKTVTNVEIYDGSESLAADICFESMVTVL
ncbi:F-box protein CPR1-like [Cornus florida]|uniref:F-box protein CPR1-like n=1 Tax=Cornus florida TaxID=4283 RepID=UPI00289CB140|nr:F-box protein CPR1-like [Cornus florida]